MADLISRAAAIAEIEEYIEEYSELEPETGYHNLKWCAMEEAKDVLPKLPAVDAVPVVRCRDCKYWEMPRTAYGIKCGYCNNMHSHVSSHRMPEENYYCPHGERRESE